MFVRVNEPFTDTAAILNVLGFKEYYGIPRGHEHDPISTRSAFTRAFRANFSLSFTKKDCNGKKRSLSRFLYVIMIAFFPRNIQ